MRLLRALARVTFGAVVLGCAALALQPADAAAAQSDAAHLRPAPLRPAPLRKVKYIKSPASGGHYIVDGLQHSPEATSAGEAKYVKSPAGNHYILERTLR